MTILITVSTDSDSQQVHFPIKRDIVHTPCMQCVFWILSVGTSINLFSNLCHSSSSVGVDNTGCISHSPWILHAHDPVSSSPIVLTYTTHHCRLWTTNTKHLQGQNVHLVNTGVIVRKASVTSHTRADSVMAGQSESPTQATVRIWWDGNLIIYISLWL